MGEQAYIAEFLSERASPELMDVFSRAIDRAEAVGTQTQLAHLTGPLLDDARVSARVSESVRNKAKAAVSEQLLELVVPGKGEFAFELASLVEPACALSRDLGAERVSPLSFLATCLAADVPLDRTSVRTQELLRSAGLTVEILVPTSITSDTRRQDFTYTSLGFGTDLTAMARAGPSVPTLMRQFTWS